MSEYQIINLDKTNFYIGGFPMSVRAQINKDVLKEIDDKAIKLLYESKYTYYDNKQYRSQHHDLIYITLNNRIVILKPNYINNKQTSKTNGIIVCKQLELHNYYIDSSKWEYLIFGK